MSKRKDMSRPADGEQGPIGSEMPFLTAEVPGLGGVIKKTPEDFCVEEVALYELSDEGTHVFAFIEKRNITTTDAMAEIAKALGKKKHDIGYAGRKDSRAITRQWISIEHVDPATVAAYNSRVIRVLEVRRHNNKLKVGHLSGNRFTIKLRDVNLPPDEALTRAQATLQTLSRVGVPNYFGPQRFGYRQDSHLLGQAVVKRDVKGFFDYLLGHPELDTEEVFIRARTLYEQGDYQAAYAAWLPNFRDHRYALKDIIRNNGDLRQAFRQFDRRLLNLFVAAWQSDLFNRVLAGRMPHINTLYKGDMAIKHDNRACFLVEDAALEQPRCDRFEISPTGPLIGTRMTGLTDDAAAFEQPLIDAMQLADSDWNWLKHYGGRGGRRALRFGPKQAEVIGGRDEHGNYLQFRFVLPSGCYATTLLRELMKT